MKIPTTLKHKPVILSEDYEQVDGRFARAQRRKGALPWVGTVERPWTGGYFRQSLAPYRRKMVPPVRRAAAAPRDRPLLADLPDERVLYGCLPLSQALR